MIDAMNTAIRNSRADIAAAFDANEKAVDSSTSQSKSALDASIEASHLDEHPWLTVNRARLSAEPQVGVALSFRVGVEYTGKAMNRAKVKSAATGSSDITIRPNLRPFHKAVRC